MVAILLGLFRLIWLFGKSHDAVALENLALRQQLWRAPRIHGELLKLGIEVSQRTVSRILQTVDRPPSQSWKRSSRTTSGKSLLSISSPCRLSVCGFCLCFW